MNKTFVPLSDSSTESLYIPVLITSYRLYSVLDDVDYTDDLVETDNDLTDEPDNDCHAHDYYVKGGINVSVRNKRGYLHDAISTGKELSVARGAIKDFIFHLISPFF